MNVVVLQPSYIPWRGYFDQLRRSDVFIFYDDVQYDHHGWRNRNRVKTPQGSQWLTIPVLKKDHIEKKLLVNDIEIDWRHQWHLKHWKTIAQAYSRAPYWSRYADVVAGFYQRRDIKLADFTIDLTCQIAHLLGVSHVHFRRSSTVPVNGSKTQRLLALLKGVGASHYLSGPSAATYLDVDLLGRHGISVEFVEYNYPAYTQLHPPYDPHVSILDLLFMTGPNASRFLEPTS